MSEDNGKKCPLRAIAYAAGKGKQFFGYDCFKEECAWWEDYGCAFLVLAKAVAYIAYDKPKGG